MDQPHHSLTHQKIAVIGAGYWGTNIIRNLKAMGSLSGICDINTASAQEKASLFDTKMYTMRELLLDQSINGIVLATPSHTHHFLGHQALLHNKHLFIEKPLSYKQDEAIELIQLAKQKQRTLMVGHILRYHPAFIKLLKTARSGIIGNIKQIEAFRLHPYKGPACDSVLWDLTPHDLSMSFALIDTILPKQKMGYSISYIDYDYDFIKCSIDFDVGINITLTNSRKHSTKTQIFTIIGERGKIVFDDTKPWESKLYLQKHQNNIPIPLEVNKEEPLRNELLHFTDCITYHKSPLTDGTEALRGIELMEQLEASYAPKTAISHV